MERDVCSTNGDSGPKIEKVQVSAYTIPTAGPESDGTLEWDRTTLVLVDVSAGASTASVIPMPMSRPRGL